MKKIEKTSFTMHYSLGLGWTPYVKSEDAKELETAKKHIKRILRRKMVGSIPSIRYFVCVKTTWFGLVHNYTLV